MTLVLYTITYFCRVKNKESVVENLLQGRQPYNPLAHWQKRALTRGVLRVSVSFS